MLVIGFAVIWAGYGLGSWGWCLLKGYDVPFRAWFTPTRGVFDWSAGAGQIPDTQVWPTADAAQPANPVQAAAGPAQPRTPGLASPSAGGRARTRRGR